MRKLRESEMRASRILQSIGDAVIVTDADTCVTDMNSVAEGLTGWHIREAVGKPLADVFKIVNESGQAAAEPSSLCFCPSTWRPRAQVVKKRRSHSSQPKGLNGHLTPATGWSVKSERETPGAGRGAG